MSRRLSKISDDFYLFCDLSNANFSLMDGLAQKVFHPFFQEVVNKKLISGSVLISHNPTEILPSDIENNNGKIRFFNNDYGAALAWLSKSTTIKTVKVDSQYFH
jgi:hypothetical protein